MSETILQTLFDELPSNSKAQNKSADALGLWERMATDLDEIAANTRHGSIRAASGRNAQRRSTPKQGQPETALTPRPKKSAVRPVPHTPVNASSTSPGIERSLIKSAQRQGQVVAKTVKKALENEGVPVGRSGRKQARDSRGRFVRQPQGGEATPTPTRSEIAQERQRKQKEVDAQAGGIAAALKGGFNSLSGLLGKATKAVAEETDAKDAAGFAVGGPAWAAYKEIKQAIPDSIKDALSKKDDEKKRDKPKEEEKTGLTRNEKGQFATAKAQARQQEAQRELAEDHFALDEKEANKNAKRHKELVRAVKDNKRGMMDRMLDRMAFGGGLPGFGRGGRIGGRLGGGGILGRVGRGAAGAAGTVATAGGVAAKMGGGLLSKAGGAAKAGGGILAKAGGLAGMGGRLLGKGALNAAKAIPIAGQLLAAGMAIYDGFNGWNDKDMHKQAFGLKDGQEATTGQKASAALANVLDLGGLGTGLLGLLGIDVNTADIARGLYDFGTTVSNLASEAKAQIANLLPDVWKGIKGIGESALAGAQELGTTLSNFAQSTFAEGEKILGDMWQGVTGFGQRLWTDLANFATSAISDAGKMLGDLWNSVKELPGKIADGAVNLATSAVEKGGELLGGAVDTVKGWFGSGKKLLSDVFSVSEAHAGTLSPEVLAKYQAEDAKNLANPAQGSASILPAATGNSLAEKTQQASREQKLNDTLTDLVAATNKQVKLLEDEAAEKMEEKRRQENISKSMDAAAESLRRASGNSTGGGGYTGSPSGGTAFAYSADAKIGDTIASFESGSQGIHKIGYDSMGGTSYGKWQLSSIAGSMEDWLKDLEAAGGEQAAIAQRIRAAGPLNTGSKTGAAVEQYLKEAAANPALIEETQRQSLLKHNYNVAMDSLNKSGLGSLVGMINGDKSLQEMAFSTSVQHGGGGAANILRKVYRQGMSREDLIKAVYKERGGRFGGSNAQVQEAVKSRFGDEQSRILGMNEGILAAQNMRGAMQKGGPEAVQTAMSSMVAAATQDAMNRNVAYKMSAKNSKNGQIDCSGWVQEMGNAYMLRMNEAMGKEVFSADARKAFNKGARDWGAAGIIQAVSQYTGELLQDDQLAPQNIREGMVIGTSKAGDGRVSDRFKGIGHIVQTYRDPTTGKIMVSQSTSEAGKDGRVGVKAMTYEDWYNNEKRKRGDRHMYGADMTKMADASLFKQQETAIANAEQATAIAQEPPAASPTLPATTAQVENRVAQMPNFEPQVTVQQDDAQQTFNAQALKIWQRMLAVLESGNKIQKAAAANNNGDGVPSISMDFDSAAANNLASDAA